MALQFLGATREVTGSCYLVSTCTTKALVECGLFRVFLRGLSKLIADGDCANFGILLGGETGLG